MKPKHRSPVSRPPKEIDPRYVRKVKSKEHAALIEKKAETLNEKVELEPEFIQAMQDKAKELHPPGVMKGALPVELSKPEQAATALWLRAQGSTYKSIEARTGLKFDTIRALCWRQEDTLETKRKEFSRKYAQVAEAFSDILLDRAATLIHDEEAVSQISPDRLAMTIGIMTDKAAQLSGMAGMVIEHRKGTSVEEAEAAIQAARARIADKMRTQAIEAEVID
jgi:hypothetical protein